MELKCRLLLIIVGILISPSGVWTADRNISLFRKPDFSDFFGKNIAKNKIYTSTIEVASGRHTREGVINHITRRTTDKFTA
jgi:hypothetical protein